MNTNMQNNATKNISYALSDIPGFLNLLYNSEKETMTLKLNKIECKTENNTLAYKIIRYDKTMLNDSLQSVFGLCRSIIANSKNEIVCFSPPKSIKASEFISKYPILSSNMDCLVAEEFVEGTMINVFWDKMFGLDGGWELATRNIVGATNSFYKSPKGKTFRVMFLEALKYCKFTLDDLEKDKCYSFVLQHPENRIVVPFEHPQLYLVAIYRIQNKITHLEHYGQIHDIQIDRVNYIDFYNKLIINGSTIKVPTQYSINSYQELVNTYASMNTPYHILGVVLHNTETGERTKIRNPVYEEVRQLRGNQPKLQYQYLSLRKEGKVGDFLKYYPEEKKTFSQFREQLHLFTNTLYQNYITCYIKKEKPLIEFSEQYRTHMFHIHHNYLTELKEKKLYVNNTFVQKYVNQLNTTLLMYCLNFHMRKRNIDFIKSTNKSSNELDGSVEL